MPVTQEDMDTICERQFKLETIIDQHSLATVLSDAECVCREKAEHVRCNWQDDALAESWEIVADEIAKAVAVATRGAL